MMMMMIAFLKAQVTKEKEKKIFKSYSIIYQFTL